MKALIGGIAIALVAWTPAFAQKPPATPTAPATQKPPVTQKPGIRRAKPPKDRGFLSLNIGAQLVSDSLVDRFSYPVNVETATTDARYKAPASLLFDAGGGTDRVVGWKTDGSIDDPGTVPPRGTISNNAVTV